MVITFAASKVIAVLGEAAVCHCPLQHILSCKPLYMLLEERGCCAATLSPVEIQSFLEVLSTGNSQWAAYGPGTGRECKDFQAVKDFV